MDIGPCTAAMCCSGLKDRGTEGESGVPTSLGTSPWIKTVLLKRRCVHYH